MTQSRPARARRLPTGLVVALSLIGLSVAFAIGGPSSGAVEEPDQASMVREGRALYLTACSSCHGLDAQGGNQAPSLIGVGAAAVDFQVGTGRMPLARPGAQADRAEVQFSQEKIDQLAAYITSLAPGPEVPRVTMDANLLALGGDLFRTNCAQCHQAAGEGGPLTYGKYAPSLGGVSPVHIAEAIRTGPESMPVFAEGQLNDEEVNAVVTYVKFITEDPNANPGGHPIGNFGPIPEGLVAWLIGIGGLVVATLWIGSRYS